MIFSGNLLLEDGNGRCRLQPGMLRVEDEKIVEVLPGETTQSPALGGRHCLICPGFIDAHLHLPQFDIVGAHGLPLLKWLHAVTFPAEAKWSDASFASAATTAAIDQLILHGTTGIAAFATVHHEATRAALKVAEKVGIRALIGQVLMDRGAPPELCRPASQLLQEAADLGSQFPAGHRVAAAVTPRFALSCSESLLHGAGKLAAAQGAIIQSHLAETERECDEVRETFGKRYVDVYRDAGLLSTRSLFGHGIHLDQDDRADLAESGSRIVHCPTANTFLRSGAMNRDAMQQSSVPLAIGSDIGAGYERSMIRVARAMIQTAARIGDAFPTAAEAWFAITAGNADALGWTDAGRLQAGATADLLVIDPTIDWMSNEVDPLSRLMFGWDDRWIRHVLLRGALQ